MSAPVGGLFRGLRHASRDPKVRGLMAFALTLIGFATLFYWFFEEWDLLDAFYFSVVTIATVGYGDIHPVTPIGKIFTVFYILVGLGIFVAAATALAQSVLSQRDVPPPPSRRRRGQKDDPKA